MSIQELIIELISQSKKATPPQLARLVKQAALAPFAEDLLEVDEPLWGGFWQGDVIAPGYRLPAIELALLRASRLDATWPEGTGEAPFLADLRRAIADPQAGVWMLAVAGEPCVVFASAVGWGTGDRGRKLREESGWSGGGGQRSVTVVWYCATTDRLHAGYRTEIQALNFEGAVEQRPFGGTGAIGLQEETTSDLPADWLEQASTQAEMGSIKHLTARLDAAILRIRHQR